MALLPNALGEFQRLASRAAWGPYFASPYIARHDMLTLLMLLVGIVMSRVYLCGVNGRKEEVRGARNPPIKRFALLVAAPNKVQKLTECLWYLMWHSLSTALCLYALFYSEWNVRGDPATANWSQFFVASRDKHWYLLATPDDKRLTGATGWPSLVPSEFLRTVYLLELAFWISCLAFSFLETRQSDFYVMVTHHLATILLIGLSWTVGFYRMGLIVLLLHDPVDTLLYLAKALLYSKDWQALANYPFAALLLSWFTLRLVAFPLLCVLPSFTMDSGGQLLGGFGDSSQHLIPGGILLPFCLSLLQLMHCFWFFLLVKIALASVKGENLKDERDLEDEDDEQTELDTPVAERDRLLLDQSTQHSVTE